MDSGGSPDCASAGSGRKRSSGSSGGRPSRPSSSRRKEFFRKFVDSEILTAHLDDWFSVVSKDSGLTKHVFDVPFDLKELQNFDYALEGVAFQQLMRMPSTLYASTSNTIEATAHLAVEDFLHAGVKGLWETFWGQGMPIPLSVACIHSSSSKFYPAERAIASGKLDDLCATAIMLKRHAHGKWDQILQLALLRPDIGTLSVQQSNQQPSPAILGEALFFALRVLLSRSLSRSSTILRNSNCVSVLLVDSEYGGVVKLEGDLDKLDFDVNNVYECSTDWIKTHAKVSVSPVERIWNKLGNANWGDVGTLQVLLSTFHCMVQFFGTPQYSFEDLATEHGSRLQYRRTERELLDTNASENGLSHVQHRSISPEIVEVHEESVKIEPRETLRLEKGSLIWLDDPNWQKGFQIDEVFFDGELLMYRAFPIEEPGKAVLLYIGSSQSHLEPAWGDMSQWYQVQRQTKVLTLMKNRGLSSKFLPQVVASGRIVHPAGECNTPVLVTSPVGETVSYLITHGLFGPKEALRCCHDCLSALSLASSAGIRHGDIRPENILRVSNSSKHPSFVLIGWGHAVLEDRDRPSMNLFFSSTYALQEGKLCASSDAESLIYLLYFSCGGDFPELDSIEGAFQWREASWSRRVIQQKLGDVSAVLKAFADYVDSLCGTPYPMDYEIWLLRLRKTISEDDCGKEIVVSS